MNILNDAKQMDILDTQNMMGYLHSMPKDLQLAWQMGLHLALPKWDNITRVLICGMGGSAIGADMAATYASYKGCVPVMVHRDYNLPEWVKGAETLVIASSHSGNTEETLSSFHEAGKRGCRRMAVCTGGKLAELADAEGAPVWRFKHEGQPRAAVPYSFGLLLAALTQLNIIPNPEDEISEAWKVMEKQRDELSPSVPVFKNPAKRQAGQWMNRWVMVLGSDYLVPIARRWKGQISELAKAWAQFEALPEADHNTLAGVFNPETILMQTTVMFLQAESNHPRNTLRAKLTRGMMLEQGMGTDVYMAPGHSALAQMWSALQFGDYAAYYLAMLYGVDPTPIPTLVALKESLNAVK